MLSEHLKESGSTAKGLESFGSVGVVAGFDLACRVEVMEGNKGFRDVRLMSRKSRGRRFVSE